jgi:hypothetical protein
MADVMEKTKPSIYLTLGNEFFMRELYKDLEGTISHLEIKK